MPQARFATYNDRRYRREKIVAARRDGARLDELVARYGLSANWTRTILREAGMPSRRREKNGGVD